MAFDCPSLSVICLVLAKLLPLNPWIMTAYVARQIIKVGQNAL